MRNEQSTTGGCSNRPFGPRRLGGGVAAVALVLLVVLPARADEPRLAYLQGLVGAAGFDRGRLSFAENAPGEPDAVSTNDLSTMPCLGVAGQFALADVSDQVGIDASLLVGWRSRRTSLVAGGGQARVDIDAQLWLADLAVGLYAQTLLDRRWRLYGAAGPLLLFGEYSDDTRQEDAGVAPPVESKRSSSESAFGVGGYARFGVEYRIAADAFLGVMARGIATNLRFDRAAEAGDLTGVQGFVTFTRAY